MSSHLFNLKSSFTRHFQASLLTLPAVFAIVGFHAAPDWRSLIFATGRPVLVHNLCQLLLLPYVAAFILSLGRVTPGRLQTKPESPLTAGDIVTIDLFVLNFSA